MKLKEQTYENIKFKDLVLIKDDIINKEFSNCTFNKCDWQFSNLQSSKFIDCKFMDCNLSNIQTDNCAFQNVKFVKSKLFGINFSTINKLLMALEFEECNIQICNFFETDISKTKFNSSIVRECDFTKSNIEAGSFYDCDLKGSKFYKTNLKKVDFSKAKNYFIDLQQNEVAKAKFTWPEIINLLAPYDINIEY